MDPNNHFDTSNNEFVELIPRNPPTADGAAVSGPTQRKVIEGIKEVRAKLPKRLTGNDPVSFFAVLFLPDELKKWDDIQNPLLIDLLADNGILFSEARPLANDDFSQEARTAMRRSDQWHSKDGSRYLARSETLMKSEWDAPAIISEVKNRKQQLDDCDETKEKELFSEVRHERSRAKKLINGIIISQAANKRFTEFQKSRERIQNETKFIRTIGLNLMDHINKSPGDYDEIGEAYLDLDDVDKKAKKSENIQSDGQLRNSSQYRNLLQDLMKVFCWFVGADNDPSVLEKIKDGMDLSISFSLQREFIFYVGNDDTNLTSAPVVSYLIFRKYKSQILKNALHKIRINAILGRYHMSSCDTKTAVRDFELYARLRSVFATFYGAAYSDRLQAIWDMAFLYNSGYISLRFQDLKQIIHTIELLPENAFFLLRQIERCVDCNRIINLARTPSFRQNHILDRFHPSGTNDPGWSQVICIQDALLEERKLIEKYLSIIVKSHSDKDVTNLIDSCFNSKGAEKLFSDLNLFEIFPEITVELSSRKVNVLCTGVVRAAYEYSIRFLLAEFCEEKLFRWLKTLILIPYEELDDEAEDESAYRKGGE